MERAGAALLSIGPPAEGGPPGPMGTRRRAVKREIEMGVFVFSGLLPGFFYRFTLVYFLNPDFSFR
eukprot:scaffold118388_cov32-Tisochrysis_lutea.AAC.3